MFQDVAPGAYYHDAVEWAYHAGVTQGISATKFGPDEPCTRAQAVTFLGRSQPFYTPEEGHPFTDVTESSFYWDYMLWAVHNGITTGTTATTFSPNDVCTRAHIVTFLQ